ncbi:hypothetical protein LCGC14_1432640 [marine sediment metagenome]|uniref:Uncharacterized protein n=1 Tax=marine sediment metagenome TaxID=412755 RepID=A0A0F9JN28_9ZZZZ
MTAKRTIKSPPRPRPISMMTMVDTKSADRILCEWAGFEYNTDWSDYNPYKDPDGHIIQQWVPFRNSLDNQAKWLWWKVYKLGHLPDVLQAISMAVDRKTNPAEACAEAILALIEEEK